MRPLPALSLAYFGTTADGNTALPAGAGAPAAGAAAGAGAGAVSFFGLASATGAAGVAGAAAAGAAAGVASAAHWALRKSFHFWPFRVPASLAALYFALHSCMLRACAGAAAAKAAKPDTATAHNNFL